MVAIIPAKPEYNRFLIPESKRNVQAFKNYVLKTLFPKEYYSLKEETDTGFILSDNVSGNLFLIECRHKFSLIANGLKFSRSIDTSKTKIKAGLPSFLVVGIGGSESTPTEIFMINFADKLNAQLLKRHLRSKAIPTDKAIVLSDFLKEGPKLSLSRKKTA